jgi:hypothetical protein
MRVLIVVLAAAGLALGQGISRWKGNGDSLLRFCTAYVQAADKGAVPCGGAIDATFCVGFLTGIQDYDLMLSQIESRETVFSTPAFPKMLPRTKRCASCERAAGQSG